MFSVDDRLAFDEDRVPDLTEEIYLQDIHCISSLLKMYFRELPNPLLTYQLYDKFAVSPKVCKCLMHGIDSVEMKFTLNREVQKASFFFVNKDLTLFFFFVGLFILLINLKNHKVEILFSGFCICFEHLRELDDPIYVCL